MNGAAAPAALSRFGDLGLVLPARGPSLAHVLPAIGDALGVGLGTQINTSGVAGAIGTAPDDVAASPAGGVTFEPGRRFCVVLVDGLGLENLAERSGHAPTLRRALNDAVPLTTTFPSTTAAGIGAFGTGEFPGRTGMLGYSIRNPASGELANLIQWTNLPEATTWQTAPSVFEQLDGAGVPVTSIGPARFAASGMTAAVLRGARYVAAESLTARVDAAAAALREDGLVYLYWGDVDKVGHHEGWQSRQWGDELEQFDAEFARLLRMVPAGVTVVLTADHGMIDVDLSQRWDVTADRGLAEDVTLVAGEPRANHVYLDQGADHTVVAERWTDVLGEAAVVLTRDEAIVQGLFGPVRSEIVPVIGDLIVAMTGRATIVDPRTQTPASLSLVGVHGSLTPTEMTVPLLRWNC